MWLIRWSSLRLRLQVARRFVLTREHLCISLTFWLFGKIVPSHYVWCTHSPWQSCSRRLRLWSVSGLCNAGEQTRKSCNRESRGRSSQLWDSGSGLSFALLFCIMLIILYCRGQDAGGIILKDVVESEWIMPCVVLLTWCLWLGTYFRHTQVSRECICLGEVPGTAHLGHESECLFFLYFCFCLRYQEYVLTIASLKHGHWWGTLHSLQFNNQKLEVKQYNGLLEQYQKTSVSTFVASWDLRSCVESLSIIILFTRL